MFQDLPHIGRDGLGDIGHDPLEKTLDLDRPGRRGRPTIGGIPVFHRLSRHGAHHCGVIGGQPRAVLENINLNFAEAAFLCEALRALWLSPQFTERMWTEMLEVSRAEGLDEKWATSGDALSERLGKVNPQEAFALVRAAIKFGQRRNEPTARLLHDLGLLPSQETSLKPVGSN